MVWTNGAYTSDPRLWWSYEMVNHNHPFLPTKHVFVILYYYLYQSCIKILQGHWPHLLWGNTTQHTCTHTFSLSLSLTLSVSLSLCLHKPSDDMYRNQWCVQLKCYAFTILDHGIMRLGGQFPFSATFLPSQETENYPSSINALRLELSHSCTGEKQKDLLLLGIEPEPLS